MLAVLGLGAWFTFLAAGHAWVSPWAGEILCSTLVFTVVSTVCEVTFPSLFTSWRFLSRRKQDATINTMVSFLHASIVSVAALASMVVCT